MSAGVDSPFGIRYSAITHMPNNEATGVVQAWIEILGIIANMLACHTSWGILSKICWKHSTNCVGWGLRGKTLNTWLSYLKKYLYFSVQCDVYIVHWPFP